MEGFAGRVEVWRKRGSQLAGVKVVVAYFCRTGVWLQFFGEYITVESRYSGIRRSSGIGILVRVRRPIKRCTGEKL